MKCNISIEIDELTVEGSAHVEFVLALRKLADELAQIQAFDGHRGMCGWLPICKVFFEG